MDTTCQCTPSRLFEPPLESCPATRPGMLNVHLLAHTHMDLGWLKTVDQYFYGTKNYHANVGVRYIFESVLNELENDPSRRFIFVETGFFNLWWKKLNETRKARFDALVQSGRMEFISGGWVMNDEACVHYTNTIDQMTYGIRLLKDTFGKCGVPKIGWQIDPFGHSREYASLLAQMGMDGYFFGRLDHQDFAARKREHRLEFIWDASENLGKDANIFTGILPNTYSPPSGFCFDIYCSDEAIVDDPDSDEYNVKYKVDDFLSYARKTATFYKTDNIPVTMGNDFNYQSAGHWFINLDKLIHHANLISDKTKIHLLYSTPSCYLKALHESKAGWTTKTDDFFPYASDPHAFWTGYFTSRPAFKFLDRYANNQLQAAKQLGVLAGPREVTEASLNVLREALAVGQHHDAITGTAKQAVANDYVKHIARGLNASDKYTTYAFEKLLPLRPQSKVPHLVRCHTLNISACEITETTGEVSVVVYNPLATPFRAHLRIPVMGTAWRVIDGNRKEVSAQITKIPTGVTTLPERFSKADQEIVFTADLPALGFTTYFVEADNFLEKRPRHHKKDLSRDTTATCQDAGTKEMVLKGNVASAFINCESGLLSAISWKGTTIRVNQSFYWYLGHPGNNSQFQYRASGAYIFRPEDQEPLPVADKAELVYIEKNGSIVQEVHQKFSEWLTQVIRVYDDADFVEFDWVVGSIPVDDNNGKEIITRFDTDLKNYGVFYTDANGREILQRSLNYRPTWKLRLREPVAGNYYPVNSRIFIRDNNRNLQFTVLTDRSQGGSSLRNGSVELMVHRRLLYDDAFGVDEALNESYYNGRGLVVRGTHRVSLTPLAQAAQVHRPLAMAMYAAPTLHFAPMGSKAYTSECKTNCSALANSLPPNVHLLTLEHWNKGEKVLLRLEHFFEYKDHAGELSKPANFSLQDVFVRTIANMTEMNLAATKTKERTVRLEFEHKWSHKDKRYMSGDHKGSTPVYGPDYYVYLTPMQIRTFLVTFSSHDKKHMVCSSDSFAHAGRPRSIKTGHHANAQ
ncbi:lysosomal alpha-mannosidase-like isoform X2 [Dermacentor silvarum]|uniref:lysosomal alpha-mannosidase-like isoform X2 n=1 Tax=Dermacentor silvarum TaxID=543639 RepID=UPI002101A964|nr:lysosomal alpha-mannosidase-like isoform X2 [Dermacentor silvarum]